LELVLYGCVYAGAIYSGLNDRREGGLLVHAWVESPVLVDRREHAVLLLPGELIS
jgi:hypothetical protein